MHPNSKGHEWIAKLLLVYKVIGRELGRQPPAAPAHH
jgi:hypothetical protein